MTYDELLAEIDFAIDDSKYDYDFNCADGSHDFMLEALRAVVELHKPVEMMRGVGKENYSKKLFCSFESDDQRYPCPTIQAIEKELQ